MQILTSFVTSLATLMYNVHVCSTFLLHKQLFITLETT